MYSKIKGTKSQNYEFMIGSSTALGAASLSNEIGLNNQFHFH